MTAASEHMAMSSASFMFRSSNRHYRLSDRLQSTAGGQLAWSPLSYLRVSNFIVGSGAPFFFTLNSPSTASTLSSGLHFSGNPSFFVPARSYLELWTRATSIAGILSSATAGAIVIQGGVL